MLDLIREHWLALISLVIALIGGVPGIVAVLNEWKARPKIAAYLHHLIPIRANDVWGESLAGLILHVAIGNKGKEPLVPLAFQLECKIDGRWEIGFDELNSIFVRMPIKLKCIDLFGRVHELILNKDLKPTIRRHSDLVPGRGVEVSVSPEKDSGITSRSS